MTVDIYIREREGGREIRIPWLPESIDIESGGTVFATYDIMNKGPVEIPMGAGLCGYSWESQFPGKNRQNDMSLFRGGWQDPSTYHSILNDWKVKGTPLVLLVTGYPINQNVYLEDYSAKATGGFGDLEYKLTFVETADITINTTKVSDTAAATKRPSETAGAYTIKSGDTLWALAEKYLGDGSKWEIIYNANKEIIDSTATERWAAQGIDRGSQNGQWIFPGTVITIPSAGNTSGAATTTTATTSPAATTNTTTTVGKNYPSKKPSNETITPT